MSITRKNQAPVSITNTSGEPEIVLEIDDRKILHFEAIINSMTPAERDDPRILNGSRRARIARGSGRPVHEINQLVKQFQDMKKMMKSSSVRKLLGGLK